MLVSDACGRIHANRLLNNLKPKNHQIEIHHLRTGVPQRLMEHYERTESPKSRGKQTTVM